MQQSTFLILVTQIMWHDIFIEGGEAKRMNLIIELRVWRVLMQAGNISEEKNSVVETISKSIWRIYFPLTALHAAESLAIKAITK